MIVLLTWLTLAHATSGYDPSTPDASFVGLEAYTLDGAVRLWASVERHRDRQADLFGPQEFNRGLEWPADDAFAPFIADCFGTARPESDAFLLHVGLHAGIAEGTPILLVPGAGDNASRGLSTLHFRFDTAGRPVYAMTFSHPHGDVFQQAESIADAIARVRHLTGAAQVDVVAHSKGGVALAVYLSHAADADWDHAAYEAHGTPYRGDVRRAVFVATPLGGVDTTFRWPANNLAGLDAREAVSPTSWDTWYPNGVAVPATAVDLSDQDLYDGGRDLFPGQRQLLRPQDAPLPGALPWLGAYALAQQDWYTTWHGGTGFVSRSRGVEAAVADGGDLIGHLEAQGVDPRVGLYLLAGANPLMTNGTPLLLESSFGEVWDDWLGDAVDVWGELMAEVVTRTFPGLEVAETDLEGLATGKLVLGEVTARSDGLVFVDSALHEEALTARGAVVVEQHVANLSHLDLLYASPITGQLIADEAARDPSANGWMQGVADRYVAEDTLGWIEAALADPPGAGDTDAPDDDTDAPGADPSRALRPPGVAGACGCAAGGGAGWVGLLGLALVRRRRTGDVGARSEGS